MFFMKVCFKCKEEKSLIEFHKYIRSKDGYKGRCKECIKLDSTKYYQKNKEDIIHRGKKYAKSYYEENKTKKLIYQKKYREKNKDKISLRMSTYRVKNKENIADYRKDYYEKTNERQKIRLKYKNDNLFRLANKTRALIGFSLRRKKYTKKTKTYKILGCTYEDFSKHLESRFTENMNWNNMDKWEIDHIIPLASANNEEELIKLNHYKNTQPLWRYDNRSKSDDYNKTDKKKFLDWYDDNQQK